MKVELIKEISVILPLHKQIFGKEFPMTSYVKKGKNNKFYMFIYKLEELIVGYSIIVRQEEISNLYAWYGGVLPEYQNRGINREFLEYLLCFAREKGYSSVTLASSNMRPHMLRLAIKLGFDIDDIKKRTTGDGNKIYFKYRIFPDNLQRISLKNVEENAIYFADLERKAVEIFKSNCTKLEIVDVNELGLKYFLRYLNSFTRQPKITIKTVMNRKIEEIIREYKGKIVFE